MFEKLNTSLETFAAGMNQIDQDFADTFHASTQLQENASVDERADVAAAAAIIQTINEINAAANKLYNITQDGGTANEAFTQVLSTVTAMNTTLKQPLSVCGPQSLAAAKVYRLFLEEFQQLDLSEIPTKTTFFTRTAASVAGITLTDQSFAPINAIKDIKAKSWEEMPLAISVQQYASNISKLAATPVAVAVPIVPEPIIITTAQAAGSKPTTIDQLRDQQENIQTALTKNSADITQLQSAQENMRTLLETKTTAVMALHEEARTLQTNQHQDVLLEDNPELMSCIDQIQTLNQIRQEMADTIKKNDGEITTLQAHQEELNTNLEDCKQAIITFERQEVKVAIKPAIIQPTPKSTQPQQEAKQMIQNFLDQQIEALEQTIALKSTFNPLGSRKQSILKTFKDLKTQLASTSDDKSNTTNAMKIIDNTLAPQKTLLKNSDTPTQQAIRAKFNALKTDVNNKLAQPAVPLEKQQFRRVDKIDSGPTLS